MRYLGMRTLTQFLAGQAARARTPRIFKLYWSEYHQHRHRARGRHPRRRRDGADGRVAATSFQTDDPGAPNDSAVVGGHVLQRPGGHDLRRLEPGAAQHHRRDDPRPAKEPKADTGAWKDAQKGLTRPPACDLRVAVVARATTEHQHS